MNICRITAIKPDGKPWGDPPNGPYYPFYVTFADGASGQANAKTNPPAYKVGDEVGYLINGASPRGVPKLKIDRKADPAQCRNTTPQDSHPDLEAKNPNQTPTTEYKESRTFTPNPRPVGTRQAGFEGQGRGESGRPANASGTPLNGQTVGMAVKAAVDLWIASGAAQTGFDPTAENEIERIARQIVAMSERIQSGQPTENVPF